MAIQIATEKSPDNTTVTVPVHHEFTESLPAAPAAGIIGAEVLTGTTGQRPRPADEQEGSGGEVQEIRGPGRRQRAEEELPWAKQQMARTQ
jgi:hypothetical protein